MLVVSMIAPCLWFDDQAELAAQFYTGIFPNVKINSVVRYGEVGREFHGREPGSVMTVAFELGGVHFTALNGGPRFQFSEAISFQVNCQDQQEIDYYWERLGDAGDPKAQRCGWLKDRFGVSWQIVPSVLGELALDSGSANAERAMMAMLEMKKLDIATLRSAYDGAA